VLGGVSVTIFDLGAEPIIVPDLDEQTYHAHPALSSTGARTLLRVAAKFDWDRTHPVHKDVFDLGSAVHTMVLGTGWPVDVHDFDNWQTKAARAAKAESRANGRVPLLRKDFEVVEAMAFSVLNDRRARRIFESDGLVEASMFAEDPATGVPMRARPDFMTPIRMVDLKTANDASDDGFARSAADYGYATQEWFYRRVRRIITGEPDVDFLFVVVEKQPPYLVNVIELDAEFAQIGRSQVERALRTYAECVERYGDGPWPGYGNPDEPDEPNLIGPPGWLSYSEGMEL